MYQLQCDLCKKQHSKEIESDTPLSQVAEMCPGWLLSEAAVIFLTQCPDCLWDDTSFRIDAIAKMIGLSESSVHKYFVGYKGSRKLDMAIKNYYDSNQDFAERCEKAQQEGEYNYNGIPGCVVKGKINKKGIIAGLYNTKQSGITSDEGHYPWVAVCETHNVRVFHKIFKMAERDFFKTKKWCEGCKKKKFAQ